MCHNKLKNSNKKKFFLDKVSRNATIIALQEVHGTLEEMKKLFYRDSQDFHIIYSPSTSRAVGGVVTMIRKSIAPSLAAIQESSPIPGRVQRIVFKNDTGQQNIVYNVHNYGLTKVQAKLIASEMEKDIADAHGDPMNHTMWILGDWNFVAPGEVLLSHARPVQA